MAAQDAALLAAITLMLAAPALGLPRELVVEPTLDLFRSALRAVRGSLLLIALLVVVGGAIWIGDSLLRARASGERGHHGVGPLIAVITLALLAAPTARLLFGGTEADDVPDVVPIRPRRPVRSVAWYEGQGLLNVLAFAAVIGLIVYVSADVRRQRCQPY